MGATWGTIGTVVILVTGTAWLLLAFRPIEAGALVADLGTPALRVAPPSQNDGGRPIGPASFAFSELPPTTADLSTTFHWRLACRTCG